MNFPYSRIFVSIDSAYSKFGQMSTSVLPNLVNMTASARTWHTTIGVLVLRDTPASTVKLVRCDSY